MAAGMIVFRFSDGGFLSIQPPEDNRTRRLPITKGLGLVKIENGSLFDFHFAFSKIDVDNGGLRMTPGTVFNFSMYPTKILYKRGKPL